jgi:hypothetical protein
MMKSSCTSLRLLVALALLVAGSGARASAGEAEFRSHYDKALNLYSAEDYEGAIREFQAAYAIKPRPRLLFNLGQAHRNLGNYKEALRFYLLYQAMEPAPKPGLRSELERYIAQMKELLGEANGMVHGEDPRPHAGDAPPPADPGAPPPAPSSPPTAPLLPPPLPALTAAPLALTQAPPPRHTPVYKRGWFWGVLAGSAATVLTIGLAAGLSAGGSNVPHVPGGTHP